jgi:hypothetical protein
MILFRSGKKNNNNLGLGTQGAISPLQAESQPSALARLDMPYGEEFADDKSIGYCRP